MEHNFPQDANLEVLFAEMTPDERVTRADELKAEREDILKRRQEILGSRVWAFANGSSCEGGGGYGPYVEIRAQEADLTAQADAIGQEIALLFEV